PYQELVQQNAGRSKSEGEFELWQTAVLNQNRFFDIEIEYAKADPYDILIRATAKNCGPEPAALHLLPTIWFRNTWSWGRDSVRPLLQETRESDWPVSIIEALHEEAGRYWLFCERPERLLFTENESNLERLWSVP